MKTCSIIFSGHIRNFEELLPNFKENILDSLKEQNYLIDIYFSIWSHKTARKSWADDGEPKLLTDISYIQELSPVVIDIENYDKTKDIFLKFACPGAPDNLKTEDNVLFSTPMFYKRNRVFSLLGEKKYDVVMIYRANLFFDEPLIIDRVEERVIYNKKVKNHDRGFTDDIFAYGDQFSMGLYCELYNNLSYLLSFGKYSPEEILHKWLETNAIFRADINSEPRIVK